MSSRPQVAPVPNALAHQSQLRRALRQAGVQPRLEVGAVNDPLELEADAAAERSMRMRTPETALSATPRDKLENLVQKKASATHATPVSPEMEADLHSLKGGGTPLDAPSRAFFEPRFGQDFSQVRLHAGASASRMAKALQAKAFTLGSHIAFGASSSPSDKNLLGHELAHVVQQNVVQQNVVQQNVVQQGVQQSAGGQGGLVQRQPEINSSSEKNWLAVQEAMQQSLSPKEAWEIAAQQSTPAEERMPASSAGTRIGQAFSNFNAELDTTCCSPDNNAELTLTLRMNFQQINPAGGANSGTYHDYGDVTAPTRRIIKWAPAAWSNWKAKFVSSAQSFWTGKFWLINTLLQLPHESKGVTYYPNVWCRFKLEATESDAHHTINVVRLDRRENWFGSHSTLYDSRDMDAVQKGTTSQGKKVMQRAHVHEVGHLLGLEHVDVGKPHCPASGNTNAPPCYGVTDEDMQSLMGAGMQLRVEHAEPWRSTMQYLVPAMWPAKMRRHYPRTAEEVVAGTAITSRSRGRRSS